MKFLCVALAISSSIVTGQNIVGPIKSCPQFLCLDVYDPVCGTDGFTYPNSCRLTEAKCYKPTLEIAYKGPCEGTTISPSIKPTIKTCLRPVCAYDPDEKPFCASNGKTYFSKCAFSYAQCLDKTLKIVHEGPCLGISNPTIEPPPPLAL